MLPPVRDRPGPTWPRYRVGPVVVDAVRREELVAALVAAAGAPRGLCAGYVNAHVFELAHHDPALADALAGLGVVFCDGFGALSGLRFLGAPLPARMTPPDFVEEIFAGLVRQGRRLFVLGDEPAVARAMADRLEERWHGLVAGHHHGFFAAAEEAAVIDLLRLSGAGLVLAGMGTPRQEHFLASLGRSAPELSALAVGGLFRWYTGTETRGPRWLTDHGFEWLCRLAVQPRKVARRYLLGLPCFVARVVALRVRGIRVRPID